MFVDSEAACCGYLRLALLDFGIVKLFDMAALHAHQVVVMFAFVQFENRFVGFEMMTNKQARLLELGEHAVHRRQARVGAFLLQQLVDILSRQMTDVGTLEQFQDA